MFLNEEYSKLAWVICLKLVKSFLHKLLTKQQNEEALMCITTDWFCTNFSKE